MSLNILKLTSNNKSYNLVPREDMLTTLFYGDYLLYNKNSDDRNVNTASVIELKDSSDGTFSFGSSIFRDISSIVNTNTIIKYNLPYLYLDFSISYAYTNNAVNNHSTYTDSILFALHSQNNYPMVFDGGAEHYDENDYSTSFCGSINLNPYTMLIVKLCPSHYFDTDENTVNDFTSIKCSIFFTNCVYQMNVPHIYDNFEFVSMNLKRILCPNTTDLSKV